MDSRLDAISIPEWERLARDARYRVSNLARSVNVSPQHLGLVFRRHSRLSPKAWLARLMVQDALRHLRKGDPIKEFFDELGFRHPNDFARAFRRLTRCQPKAARVLLTVQSSGNGNSFLNSYTFEIAPKRSKNLRNLRKG